MVGFFHIIEIYINLKNYVKYDIMEVIGINPIVENKTGGEYIEKRIRYYKQQKINLVRNVS